MLCSQPPRVSMPVASASCSSWATSSVVSMTLAALAASHIRRFLMQRAQQLLISGATVSQTAEQLGFEYPQHFTRQFKKHFGVPPSEYIKKKGN